MDNTNTHSLIANSGIHFKTTYLKVNPQEPLILKSGKTLRYTFIQTNDFINQQVSVDVCTQFNGSYVPVSYAIANHLEAYTANGVMMLNESGLPMLNDDTSIDLVLHKQPDDPELININSLGAFRLKRDNDMVTAFKLLLGKWLPMPMFEDEITGQSIGYPLGWCRVRLDMVGTDNKDEENDKNEENDIDGTITLRCTWAFDTRLAGDSQEERYLRPTFLAGSGEKKSYQLCNRTDLLLGHFLNIPDGENYAPVSDYLVSLLNIDLSKETENKYKFIAYYVYLINYLRLTNAAPIITLYNKPEETMIPVDMSVDIGNSRTCAVLFEKGLFDKARMLRLSDLSEPWQTYENAFDMRIVFRRADFGGDITFKDKTLFQWPSLVRVGEEARHLVYKSMENTGESERTTNYSSPKRYLWDDKPFKQQWEQMVIKGDPTNLQVNTQIFMDGFTDHFDSSGNFLDQAKEIDFFSLGQSDDQCHYSRRSLMTFVMIEMFQQALCYINSSKFRYMHGEIDCRRYLRNIIITCPTAMSLVEQRALRNAAKDASSLLHKLTPSLPKMSIIPDPSKLHSSDDPEVLKQRGWLFDEAFSSQLVYLYAELAERYKGRIDHFFSLKGHLRPELKKYRFEGNCLTIGTIDIGAGTTDVMITAYGQRGQGRITPVPLFYDSFYTAGDDILHNIIRDVILEGDERDDITMGSIGSSVLGRIMNMTPDELLTIPRIADHKNYRETVDDIRNAISDSEAASLKRHLAHELMHHFFADNSANQSAKDRQCRLDFCTQISVPIAQFFMELLKQHRPNRLYNFKELFPKEKPAAFLLEHFAYHFGFRFEELSWLFDSQLIGHIVRHTMEPLIKALSMVIYSQHCDILVLSGRPTNLEPLTELMLKYIPIPPHRLVLLNEYRVGRWYPLGTEEGYFQESQKAVVAVGAEVGYQASTTGFKGLVIDFSRLAQEMKSTARFMGLYDEAMQEVHESLLAPSKSTAMLRGVTVFPCYIGCKQFDALKYQARPLYAIYNHSRSQQLNIMLQRNYHNDREMITIEDVTDIDGENIPNSDVELRLQTLSQDGSFWMDKGAFKLDIQEK